MQARTAPTSPAAKKSQAMADVWMGGPLQQPPKTPWVRVLLMIVTVTLLLNVATITTFGWYVHRYPASWLARIAPLTSTTTSTTVIQSAKDSLDNVIPSAVQKARSSAYGLARNQGQAGVYRLSDTLGLAWPLSSSGWAVSVTGAWPADVKSLVLVPLVGQTQAVTSTVSDPGTQFIFLKSTELAAQPLTLGSADDLTVGMSVWVIDDGSAVSRKIIQLVEPRWASSDRDENFYQLDSPVALAIGSAVLTNDGHFVGLLGPENRLWPLPTISSVVKQVIQQATITRPVFGVRTLNQASARITSQPTASGLLIGADTGETPVVAKSPADKAGLKAGDIITALDGHAPTVDLFTSLSTYQAGDDIKVTYLRAGQEKTVNVSLTSSR